MNKGDSITALALPCHGSNVDLCSRFVSSATTVWYSETRNRNFAFHWPNHPSPQPWKSFRLAGPHPPKGTHSEFGFCVQRHWLPYLHTARSTQWTESGRGALPVESFRHHPHAPPKRSQPAWPWTHRWAPCAERARITKSSKLTPGRSTEQVEWPWTPAATGKVIPAGHGAFDCMAIRVAHVWCCVARWNHQTARPISEPVTWNWAI